MSKMQNRNLIFNITDSELPEAKNMFSNDQRNSDLTYCLIYLTAIPNHLLSYISGKISIVWTTSKLDPLNFSASISAVFCDKMLVKNI